jgi:magnesium-protoporphyrin O-methyltransferase
MDCCCGTGFASIFDARTAEGDLRRYIDKGPDGTTRLLLDLIRPYVEPGSTVLDVGSGIGVIDHELLAFGAGRAVLVDASPAYLDVARREASRRNVLERLELVEGNFVGLAAEIEPADVVTLDRVVCCFGDAESLVSLSVARARRAYGLVLPRDGWPFRLAAALLNVGYRIRRIAYRAYAHPNALIDRLVAARGFVPVAERKTLLWRIVVYSVPA